ncbi:MAG: extracellular solute-binding protein [Lachnospiraceae bacterium]|nr:extracellular solute-binding protein [Lachnospiraceae bacterium]
MKRKHVWQRFMALCLAMVLVLGLSACGGKSEGEEAKPQGETAGTTEGEGTGGGEDKVTIRWVAAGWSMNDKANKIIQKWNEIHPEVEVEYIELSSSVDETFLANLDTMISGGEVVDVVYLEQSDIYKRAISGGVLPMDEYIQAAGDDYEDMYGSLAVKMFSYDGHVIGVPYAGNTFKVFYNKTMTDAANIQIPENWSYEEFLETAKKLNDPENGVYGCVWPFNWADTVHIMAENSGWSMIKEQEDGTIAPNFDDEILKKCMQDLYNLSAVDKVSPDLATIKAESLNRRWALANQQAAMIVDGPYTLVYLQNYMYDDPGAGELEFELGVTNIPYMDENGKDVSYYRVNAGFYIPKSSAHPAEAYEFEKFVCNYCAEEGANYMPVFKDADMKLATKTFTEYTAADGEQHTEVYSQEVAEGAVAVDFESHLVRYNYNPEYADKVSLMTTLYDEQYALFMNGEMEIDDWVSMMQEMGAMELSNAN